MDVFAVEFLGVLILILTMIGLLVAGVLGAGLFLINRGAIRRDKFGMNDRKDRHE
jgi:hypothetical protein